LVKVKDFNAAGQVNINREQLQLKI
jgi:hypothetical protein